MQLQGNWLDADQIVLNVARQGKGLIKGRTGFSFHAKTKQYTKPGRINAETIVTEGRLQNEVDNYLRKIENEKTYENAALAAIKSLPFQGFGADKTPISLTKSATSFVEHQTCHSCHGQKQTTCAVCGGRGQSTCNQCGGTGETSCFVCNGQGQIRIGDQLQPCSQCQQRGRVYCSTCHGQQRIPCPPCQAKGHIICKACNGEGASSQIVDIMPEAITKSEIYIHDLDPEPKRMASIVSPEKLVAGGHAICKTVNPPQKLEEERAYYEDTPKEERQVVHYEVEFPWAVAELSINNKNYKIYFAGKKGAVCESDNFMDPILDKPLDLLDKAAKNAADIGTILEQACQFRFSRETLAAVVTGKKKKAAMKLYKNYSLGLEKKIIMAAVNNAYLAMKRITRKPRYIGLGLGLAVASALYTGWFLNDWRNITISQGNIVRYPIDIIVYLIGASFTMAAIKLNGLRILKSVFDRIHVPITFKTIPAAGKAGLYGWGGCLIIWGGLLSFRMMI